jgi:F-type H+-transporting ATPase subunit epsilon
MMSKTLYLTITTPAQILAASDNVVAVRAEDRSGSFGVLPGHADLLTALIPSVVRWRTVDGAARFCAVRGGCLLFPAGAMFPLHAAKALSATRSTSSKQKCEPCVRVNLKPTVRRTPSKSAFMLWRCVS